MLDELDRELERRGHRFVRYADDCNVYVGSARAGQRVMESITHFITTRLKLTVNRAKSAVGRPQARTFLGFSFTGGRRLKRRIAPSAVQRLRRRVRTLTRRSRGVSLEQMVEQLASYLRGWRGYFGFCETSSQRPARSGWIVDPGHRSWVHAASTGRANQRSGERPEGMFRRVGRRIDRAYFAAPSAAAFEERLVRRAGGGALKVSRSAGGA